jgi:lipoprotein-anchoring transpeptidase ErfK/SrfK
MSDDDIERLLAEALETRARSDVPGARPVPPPHFATAATGGHRRAIRPRWAGFAPIAAAAVVIAVVALVFGFTRTSGDTGGKVAAAPHSSQHPATRSPATAAVAKPVHVVVETTPGTTYGVGMPVVVRLSHRITDGAPFQRATRVTVNGATADAAWYFETSTVKGYPLEAHLRLRDYWPAHASIAVSMPVHGVAAGGGYEFADDLSVAFRTGARVVSTVDARTHRMTVTRDGRTVADYRVSLGSKKTPTSKGTKVVMAKGVSICLRGPGYSQCGIQDTQRLTNSGEYLVSAPWNMYNINHGRDSSDGCTNLLQSDARQLYAMSEVGDVVNFPNADGPKMTPAAGLGDWNVPWQTWREGGAVPTG